MGDLPEGQRVVSSSHTTTSFDKIPVENWVSAENLARNIIRKVQPSCVSEQKRRGVIDYIQRLITTFLGAEVYTYGSVPLKTYLPDGDIDLTAFGGLNAEDTLATEIKCILENEGKNTRAEFVVKDVQLICAEVKIVKCIVENIIVDVSFNQLGGLSTLCFLEQVDRLIGKDHLFKYSIILIKAWCYYESRILGAHHGLISTYALETLVLYIFHRFHASLDGPLAVLYKFLDYFSNFDWDNYCISLNGPVRLSSFPAIVAEMPEDGEDLLLSSDFLSSCVAKFSVPSRVGENSRGFQQKHLNIVDPLKETNNLGRSVSKGNFYRIRSAFSYGARKLGSMLLQPRHSIADELHKFFSNTMARHEGAPRHDVNRIDLHEHRDEHLVPTGIFRSGISKLPHELFTGAEIEGLTISTDSPKSQQKPCFAPHQFFANGGGSPDENEVVENDDEKVEPKDLNSLLDLTGDYESHLQCLQHGRLCYDFALDVQSLHMPPPPRFLPMSHFKQNGFSPRHHNGFRPNPPMLAMHHALMPGVPLGWEDVPKPRGMGTYFPNVGHIETQQGYRSSDMIGRNHAPSRPPHTNERSMIFSDQNLMIGSSDGYPIPPGLIVQPEGVVLEMELEKSRQPKPIMASPKSLSGMQKSKPAFSKEQDRNLFRYRLKDEDDFPPLSV